MSKKVFQFFLLGLVLMLGTALQAQTEPGRGKSDVKRTPMTAEERATKQTDRQKETLGLNDDQYQKVLAINKAHAKKQEALRTDAGKDREKHKKNAQSIEASRDAELNKVLNAEQYEKHKLNKEQKKGKMKARKGKGEGPKHRGNAPRNQED